MDSGTVLYARHQKSADFVKDHDLQPFCPVEKPYLKPDDTFFGIEFIIAAEPEHRQNTKSQADKRNKQTGATKISKVAAYQKDVYQRQNKTQQRDKGCREQKSFKTRFIPYREGRQRSWRLRHSSYFAGKPDILSQFSRAASPMCSICL